MARLSPGLLASATIAASVFVAACAHRSPVGFAARIARTERCTGIEERTIFYVRVLRPGVVRFNRNEVQLDELGARLDEAFRTRVYHVLWVMADSGLRFEDVAAVLDHAAPHTDKIVLVTQSLIQEVNGTSVCMDENLPREYLDKPPRG